MHHPSRHIGAAQPTPPGFGQSPPTIHGSSEHAGSATNRQPSVTGSHTSSVHGSPSSQRTGDETHVPSTHCASMHGSGELQSVSTTQDIGQSAGDGAQPAPSIQVPSTAMHDSLKRHRMGVFAQVPFGKHSSRVQVSPSEHSKSV